jgi:uncharacterized protein YukE
MSTFAIDPEAIRSYAHELGAASGQIEEAKSYVGQNGNFSFREGGLIGLLFGKHQDFLQDLNHMLGHLRELTDGSDRALNALAASYEQTDKRSAAKVDASYQPVTRPQAHPDTQDGNYFKAPPPTY